MHSQLHDLWHPYRSIRYAGVRGNELKIINYYYFIMTCSKRMNFTRKSCVRATTIDAADARATHTQMATAVAAVAEQETKKHIWWRFSVRFLIGRCHDCTRFMLQSLEVRQNVHSIYLGGSADTDASKTNNNSLQYAWIQLNLLLENIQLSVFAKKFKWRQFGIGMWSWANRRQENIGKWFVLICEKSVKSV